MLRVRKRFAIQAAVAGVAAGGLIGSAVHAIPAFPGAAGPGATATGGRGGDVYHVTRLDADKNGQLPGSLQYGINNAPGIGRTVVFDVAGTIYLAGQTANDTLRYGQSNITVAGQTAPGPGITIAGTATKWTGSNVILRNLTVRPNIAPVTYDAFSLQTKNSIIDHVTATWFTDEGISITDAGENSTIQYANISEGLNDAGHSYGAIVATEVDGTHYSYNHNLFAHNASRMPRLGSEIGAIGAVTDFTNNVIYNWPSKAGYSGTVQHSSTNFLANYYIKGNSNGVTAFSGGDDSSSVGFTQVYQNKSAALGNKFDYNKNGAFDGALFGPGDVQPGTSQKYWAGSQTFSATPFDVPGAGTPDTADAALQRVLDYGGANWQNRNPIDQRIVNSVRTGSGNVINDLSDSTHSAEWNTILSQRPDANGNAPFTRPAGWDTDNDGMPDAWEIRVGTNPNLPDNNGDFDSDGYTNLEEYVNDLAAWPAPAPAVWSADSGRYALQSNWNTNWQPSRYDMAQINSGTATVDAMGQAAGTISIGAGGCLAITAGQLSVFGNVIVSGKLNWSGGSLATASTSDLTIGNGAAAAAITLSRNLGQTLRAGNVTLNSQARIDLANNSMLIAAGSLAATRALLQTGYAGGSWSGDGITSSEAASVAADPTHPPQTALGYLLTVDGISIRYALAGDANLDGKVNALDFNALASNFGGTGRFWLDADFNYDGLVSTLDFQTLAANFNQAMSASALGSVVPEPGSLAWMIVALLPLRRGRRK